MAVAVYHAGDHHLAFAVDKIVGLARTLFAAMQNLNDPAVVADQQAGKAFDTAGRIDGQAINVIYQRIGKRRRSQRQRRSGAQPGPDHALPRLGRRRISDEVSCRPPPRACTSA